MLKRILQSITVLSILLRWLEDSQELARHIDEGFSFDDILDKIQMICSSKCISYTYCIRKQDLHNVSKEFSLSKSHCFHKNDAGSIAACVEHVHCSASNKDMVRYAKFQGHPCPHGLKEEDLMLIIISEIQLLALKKFSSPMKVVALYFTHETNAYHFQLTTLMVLDEHGEGFPRTFCQQSAS